MYIYSTCVYDTKSYDLEGETFDMARMMDAIVKPAAAPGLELKKVPVPVPGPGEVLIKIHKTAICGTDVHIYNWDPWAQQHIKPPMTIGHEYVGEIAELGAGVTGLRIGQRVSGEGHITCHRCRNCHTGNIQWCKDTVGVGVDRDGAFAEYVCIPEMNVIPIDESLPEDVVAFFDAFGNATHTALMFPLVGEDVLITAPVPSASLPRASVNSPAHAASSSPTSTNTVWSLRARWALTPPSTPRRRICARSCARRV